MSLIFDVGLNLRAAERQLSEFDAKASRIGQGLSSAAGTIGKIAAGFAVAGAAFGVVLNGVIGAGSEMENYNTQLTTIMHSSSAASARLDELFRIAATTKFNTGEIVAADITLRGFGETTGKLLPKLVDFSSALGTDLKQSAIDFGKAWNQGGVGLESDTGKILKSMIETEAGMKSADMTIEQFRQHMTATLDANFAGGAARAAKTWSGLISNLEDEWTGFEREVAKAGIFDNAKAAVAEVLDIIGKNRAETKVWAGYISTVLWDGIKGVAILLSTWVDMARVFKYMLTADTEAAALLSETLLDGALAYYRALRSITPDGTVSRWQEAIIYNLVNTRGEIRKVEYAAHGMNKAFEEGNSALTDTTAFFAKVEAAAAAAGSSYEDAQGKGGTKGPDSGADKLAKEHEKQLADAAEFLAQMTALDFSAEEEIQAKEDERYAHLMELRANDLVSAEQFAAAKNQIELDYDTAMIELHTRQDEDAAAERAKQLADEQAANAARIAGYATMAGGIGSMSNELTTLLGKHNKKAALAAFVIGKAAALAQIAFTAPQAIIKAFADGGIPGAIGVGLAVGAEALTVATAPPPTFNDTPAPLRVRQGGEIGFADNDIVIAGQNASDVRRQAGMLGGNDPLGGHGQWNGSAVTVIDHRAVHATIAESLRQNGPLATAIAGNTTIGHRVRKAA